MNSLFCTADVRVHEFFKTPYFKKGIHPLPGAQQALQKLSRFCNLSVVTYVLATNLIMSSELIQHEHQIIGHFEEIYFT